MKRVGQNGFVLSHSFLFAKDFRFSKLKKEEVADMHNMEDDELILIEASLI